MQINNNNIIIVDGILNYQKLLLLRDLKAKFEPKPENVRYVVLNEAPPRKKEEVAGELKYRYKKSNYSLTNIEKAIDMLLQAREAMDKYSDLIDEAKNYLADSDNQSPEELADFYNNWSEKIKKLVDTTRIKYLRLLTTEDFKKDIELRKQIRTRMDFRKKMDVQMNPALLYNKIIIHTAIPEEPFVQINIPVELGYKTYKLDEIDLVDDNGKIEFIKRLTELENLLTREKENSAAYIDKLQNIKKKIEIYRHNIESTLSSELLKDIEPQLNEKDIKDQKLNFSVVTNKTQKGMIFNFIA
ncbi:MAG TPA: hypothetical protein PLM75_09600 [bacterium]|nr:hypothetical protein [bacterium]HPP88099.1 hypothetical protein [bacterium]